MSTAPLSPPTLLTAWQTLVATAPDARALIEAATGEIHTRRSLETRATALASLLGGTRTPSALFAARDPASPALQLSTFNRQPELLKKGSNLLKKLLKKGSNLNVCGPALTALPGRLIAFSRPNGPNWLAAFLALLQLRAVPIPLDPSESPASQLALAAAARAHFLLTPDNQLHPVAPTAAPALDSQLSALNSPRLRAAPALIKLTSGSTGTPRALAFTHAQMLADGRNVCASMDIRPDDLNLGLIPFGHSYGLGNLVIPLLAQGTAILCVSAPLHHAIAADCARWQPTLFPAVPAILRILALTDVPAEALQSLRVIISAGSALPPETARAFLDKFGKRIHGFYGSSETGGITYDRTGDATLTGRSVGTPLDGVTLRFTRARRFTVSSAAVFTKNNRRRTPSGHGAHLPTDLAELNAHGELVLLGRTGRMVKIASRRLDLTALELEIKKLPGLRDAYAAPHPDRPDELACVLATDFSAADARALLHRSLAAWKIPKRLIVLKDFPLTPRGKPDAKSLRATLRT